MASSSAAPDTYGRSIQLFLTEGTPDGLIVASIDGWTGSVLVSTQATFGKLLSRPEVNRCGVYIFYGPDPEDGLRMRAYVGEADSVRERIDRSAEERGFWEKAAVITTSDETLTKGHVRYLEARLIEIASAAARVSLDNDQQPDAGRRRLPEADRASMETFLANLGMILPIVGLELLKPKHAAEKHSAAAENRGKTDPGIAQFEIRHRSGVQAIAVEHDGEFIVLKGSHALKDTTFAHNGYAHLKQELVDKAVLVPTPDGKQYQFSASFAFRSPSAAGAVILGRNTNGRICWYLIGEQLNYHEWQEAQAAPS